MKRRAVVGFVLSLGVLGAFVCWSEAQRQYQHVTAAVTVAEVLNLVASFGLAAVGLVYLAATAPPSPELRTVQLGVGGAVAISGLGGLFAVVWFRRTTVERTVAGVAFLLRSATTSPSRSSSSWCPSAAWRRRSP